MYPTKKCRSRSPEPGIVHQGELKEFGGRGNYENCGSDENGGILKGGTLSRASARNNNRRELESRASARVCGREPGRPEPVCEDRASAYARALLRDDVPAEGRKALRRQREEDLLTSLDWEVEEEEELELGALIDLYMSSGKHASL